MAGIQKCAHNAEFLRNLLTAPIMPSLRRRHSDPQSAGHAPLRSSLANAAMAVEDRVIWGAADLARGIVDVVKLPFERIAWAVENFFVWPIREETGGWGRPVLAAVLAAVLVLSGAAVAAGIAISDPSRGEGDQVETLARAVTPT